MKMTLFATCPKGVEYLLEDEARTLGLTVERLATAGLWLETDMEGALRLCLWSRLANRVILNLDAGPADSPQAIAERARAVAWEAFLPPGGTFRVYFQGTDQLIRNTRFGAQCVKDGIMDRLGGIGGAAPSVARHDPDVPVHARWHQGQLSLGVDLAGESLHRRRYRSEAGEAPLKENLAAALLIRAGWPELARSGADLVDPLCGSGTLLIEGALMATNTAPGLARYFAFERWAWHDSALWQRLREQAWDLREQGLAENECRFRGYDQDKGVVATAWRNIERAGFADRIHVERQSLEAFSLPEKVSPGLILTNPPYGERLKDREGLEKLYRTLGERIRSEAHGWRLGVFTAAPELCHQLGLRSQKKYRLFNGAIPTQLLLFEVLPENERQPREGTGESAGLPHPRIASEERARMLVNRLRKNQKSLRGWARKNDLECYRVYDADMPEFALAIDRYGDWLHVQEYAAPASVPEKAARERLAEAMAVIPEALDVASERMVVKQRRQRKGDDQYEKQADTGAFMTVTEGGCAFRVNLHDYLDTGLFLDHRPVRFWLHRHARGASVLNLFCYTGAVTVHAAAGGAAASLSLDMSNTYLDWARENWRLNGMDEKQHRLERADCLQWLAARPTEQFDLIFLDPPTFSNSAKMAGVLDTQRDHATLIRQAMGRLKKGGTLIFSTNFRRFQLEPELESEFEVEDVTGWSIDRDFARNQRIHRCYFIRHQKS